MKLKTSVIVLSALAAASVVAAEKFDISKLDLSKLPPASPKQGVTYDAQIKPLFDASCIRCHGEVRPKAGLRLDSLDAILKGGKDGKVLVPGDSKQSLLVIAVAQIDEDLSMPPKHRPGRRGPGGPGNSDRRGGPPPGSFRQGGPSAQQGAAPPPPGGGPGGPRGRAFGPPPKPLTPEQVGLVRAWIDQGAK